MSGRARCDASLLPVSACPQPHCHESAPVDVLVYTMSA
jgi:hypothetical protein